MANSIDLQGGGQNKKESPGCNNKNQMANISNTHWWGDQQLDSRMCKEVTSMVFLV